MNFVSKYTPPNLKGMIRFLFFLLIITCNIYPRGEEKYSVEEAFKVLNLIDKIEAAQMEAEKSALRKVEVTESEFNSYIAFRIDVEQEEVMKALQFKFFDENKVEGRIFIDLRGQNLPAILKPEMNVFFRANIETNQGIVRMNVKELFIESQRVLPAVLDLIIAISAKLTGEEITSINDWYELPYGIKDIVIQPGKAVFYY